MNPTAEEARSRFERIYSVEGLTIPEMGRADRFARLPNGLYADLEVRGAWHWFNRKEQPDAWYVPEAEGQQHTQEGPK